MRRLTRWLAGAVGVALIAYFLYAAALTLRRFDPSALLSPRLGAATVFMAVCYGLVIPVSGWAWHALLSGSPGRQTVPQLTAIMAVSQFGKYLPGNVGQIAGRSALALARGMPASALVLTMTLETLLALFAALGIGGIALALSAHRPPLSLSFHLPAAVAAPIAVLLAALLSPRLRTAGVQLLRRLLPRLGTGGSGPRPVNSWSLIRALGAYGATYLLIGVGLWAIGQSLGDAIAVDYWYLTGSFALAWVVGFVTPGAPAGLGVREGAMLLLLSQAGQHDAILMLVGASRIATLAADVVWFGAGLCYFRCRKP